MKPEYVTHADEHGAKIPNLRRMMAEGTYAEGVQGVVPTVTYPSHTTLVTGVWPTKHGIYANTLFDPLDKDKDGLVLVCRRHQSADALGSGGSGGKDDGDDSMAGDGRRAK